MADPLPITKANVPRALERAEHYRLLNEPAQAESICRDIVAVDPENEKAWIHLLLALTDQFPQDMGHALEEAKVALSHVQGDYHQAYYQGIIHERWGRANLQHGHGIAAVQSWINQAMNCYQKAMDLAPGDDPDPTLRWNTCARLLKKIGSNSSTFQPPSRNDVEYDEVPRKRGSDDWW